MIQFITDSNIPEEIDKQISCAINGGIRWVQLRMKDASNDEICNAAKRIVPLCHESGTTIIIDDHVELVKTCGFDGVHLGRNDMNPLSARELLGNEYIIGYTVNNADDAKMATTLPLNYVGLGPLRYTTTKKNLSPVLGIDGIKSIIKILGHNIPAVVIGGITHHDIAIVKNAGAVGVAVSGAIARANDITAAARLFHEIDRQTDNSENNIITNPNL